MSCRACDTVVSPTKKINCNNCDQPYHRKCIPNHDSITNKNAWTCDRCDLIKVNNKNLTIRKKNDLRTTNNDVNYYELTDINRIFLKLDKLVEKVNFIEKSIQFFSDKIDDYGVKIQSIADQILNFDIKIKILESNHTNTLNRVEVLEFKININ
ncbi:Orthodenticle protein [Aphis craccivora]|uniref:Orthodenticle protein n=1 Tax=Aphis craccivora TaxID=307492 RepID=A0A6G0VU08_APHCR|nr:Orthodenticle protein [Aphis craccivora]